MIHDFPLRGAAVAWLNLRTVADFELWTRLMVQKIRLPSFEACRGSDLVKAAAETSV